MTDDLTDRDLSRAWRAASSETTPRELDHGILERAREAATDGQPRNRWVQPLAFAATLVLGVALLLEMQSVEQPSSVRQKRQAKPVDEKRAADAAPQSADESRNRAVRQAAPERTPAVPDDSGTLRESSQVGASVMKTLEEPPERTESEAPAANAARLLALPASPEAERRLVDDAACDGDFRTAPDAWWQCIRALDAAGEDALAKSEREALAMQHPEFRIPE